MSNVLTVAFSYQRCGFSVIPIQPSEKKPGLLIVDVLQKFCRIKRSERLRASDKRLRALDGDGKGGKLSHPANSPRWQVRTAGRGRHSRIDCPSWRSRHSSSTQEARQTANLLHNPGDDIPETVIELSPDGALEAAGTRQEVELGETIPLVLGACEQAPITEKEIWERVEKKHDIVVKAIRVAVERGELTRTGGGKKNDPYLYGAILSCSPQDTTGRVGRESENDRKSLKLKSECSPQSIDLSSLRDGSSGREFLVETVIEIFPRATALRQ